MRALFNCVDCDGHSLHLAYCVFGVSVCARFLQTVSKMCMQSVIVTWAFQFRTCKVTWLAPALNYFTTVLLVCLTNSRPL